MSTWKEPQAPRETPPASHATASAALALGALGAEALGRLLSFIDEPAEVSSFDGRVLLVNRSMEAFRERSSAELLSSAPLWADDQLAGGAIDGVRQGEVWTGTVELAAGRQELALLPLHDGRGRVAGCLGVLMRRPLPSLLSSVVRGRSDANRSALASAPDSEPSPGSDTSSTPAHWDIGAVSMGGCAGEAGGEPPTQRSSVLPRSRASAGDGGGLELQTRSNLLENLGRMTTTFAHDFNNMLSVIDGSADLALKRIDPGVPGREQVLQIREAARRSARLTRQLLAMSRGMGVEPETLDLNALVFGLEGLLSLVVSDRVQLVSELAASPATVRIVRAQLEQVLLNLAVNARDAMPDGGKLVLRTYHVAATRGASTIPAGEVDQVVLEVSDTGLGMSTDIAARAFDAHYSTKSSGSGLGLAIVKSVVEDAGGAVAVESEVGTGTTFVVRLPCHRTMPSTRPSPRPIDRHRVLVVDDEGPVRRAVAKMVAANGLDVLVARDAGEALDLLSREKVDLLLTDVVMPGMSGVALAEAVAELHPEVAVVYMSGYAHDVILERGLDPGTMIYLQKPFTRLELLRKLAMALGTGHDEYEAVQGE